MSAATGRRTALMAIAVAVIAAIPFLPGLQNGFVSWDDDKNFLKTTKAYFAPDADEPRFEFEPVDISLLPPRPRRYDMAK